jgi:hypothetical protein
LRAALPPIVELNVVIAKRLLLRLCGMQVDRMRGRTKSSWGEGRASGRRHGGCEEKSERRLRHCQVREVDEREVRDVRGGARHATSNEHLPFGLGRYAWQALLLAIYDPLTRPVTLFCQPRTMFCGE